MGSNVNQLGETPDLDVAPNGADRFLARIYKDSAPMKPGTSYLANWTPGAPFAPTRTELAESLRLITPAESCSDARFPQMQMTATSRAFNPFEREIS